MPTIKFRGKEYNSLADMPPKYAMTISRSEPGMMSQKSLKAEQNGYPVV